MLNQIRYTRTIEKISSKNSILSNDIQKYIQVIKQSLIYLAFEKAIFYRW